MATDLQFLIKSDSPANADLMFWTIVGQESLSRPSHYELTVLSTNEKIKATDILGHAFDVVIEFLDKDGGKHERHCQGHAVRFMRKGAVGRYFEYRLTLRSWFWLLTKRLNSRIIQDKKVLDILDATFEDSPIKRFKKVKSDKVIGTHNALRYSVQHQESDFDYLSRMLEDEGIYYWFDAHDAPGTMYLADASDVAHKKLPVINTLNYIPFGASEVRFNEISHWVDSRRLDTGKYDARDSDFKAVKKQLKATKADPDTHELADLEAFEFPGGFFRNDDTDDAGKVRMEELAARRRVNWAFTRWPDIAAGMNFTFHGHPMGEPDTDYLCAACTFVVTHPGYEGLTENDGNVQRLGHVVLELLDDDPINAKWEEALHDLIRGHPDLIAPMRGNSAFLLTALPADTPYRPPRTTPRVVMPGPQSAIVVGPTGDEIHADDFGRVKVHFHWDRYDKSDEKSTCWVRVSQPWAGKGWGGYFIPRIGQEVIVDFLNGDPDRPIIIGRVYNDDQPKPFDSHTQSGFRTRSTPKGSAANCNEFRFDDKKGSEQVYLHAEKNQDIEVENDETHWVGHDRTKTIDHDETSHIKHDRTETVDHDEQITIHHDRIERVDNDETISIGRDRKMQIDRHKGETVVGNKTILVGGTHTESITGAMSITVASTLTESVAINYAETVGGAMELTVGGALATTVGAASAETVAGAKTLSVGGSLSESTGGSKTVTVGKDVAETISGNENVKIAKNQTVAIDGEQKISVTKEASLKAKKVQIVADDEISFKTGSAEILMKKNGDITIKGNKITVKGDGDLILKGSKITAN
ncbi:type VI secretion system Vgr family protein [Variovorax rhizosphaerae]|uniref:Type VI secretion system tip protein TssI/VgrG n=1 Tax=Variovorax rhizosphaerae TaxID=1836200 RepID=A0ABU8WPN0_9BURK